MFYLKFVKDNPEGEQVEYNISCDSYHSVAKDMGTDPCTFITAYHKRGSCGVYEENLCVGRKGHPLEGQGNFFLTVFIMNNEGKTLDKVVNFRDPPQTA